MNLANRMFIFLVITLTCVGCDQATKKIAEVTLKHSKPLIYFNNFFRLEYAENKGAFLSLGADLNDWHRWLLLTFVSSVVLGALSLFVVMQKSLSAKEITGYSLILAGGISNMIDRVLVGFVIDFLNFGIGSLRTGIFNIADIAIMAGLFIVIAAHIEHTFYGQTKVTA